MFLKAKAAIVEAGKTQKQVAEEMTELGIKTNRVQLSNKLNGKTGMSIDFMKCFAKAVNKDAKDLFL